MKSFPILLFLFAVVFSAFAHAAPVTARYLRFEGYYSTHYDRINIHEIEAYANGLNVAPTAAITINSGSPGLIPRLTDGITTGSSYFYSESTDDG
ncbi:MAG TPA: hypothetical protein VLO11_09285, partial [Luteolibacter sp.]|nr:hypothetical protein [Luteolibacter sp.]